MGESESTESDKEEIFKEFKALGPKRRSLQHYLVVVYEQRPLFKSRYEDIALLLEIENKWNKENTRRAKNPESVQDSPSED